MQARAPVLIAGTAWHVFDRDRFPGGLRARTPVFVRGASALGPDHLHRRILPASTVAMVGRRSAGHALVAAGCRRDADLAAAGKASPARDTDLFSFSVISVVLLCCSVNHLRIYSTPKILPMIRPVVPVHSLDGHGMFHKSDYF